ncbi:conserved oligomeric Golgi complex component [Guyanagaster necrorhizus]|uniref:Conserved oligomeric Golgi complex subunit 2 n=1 Tax=Guyanagaster necrorhizus TaxID=856835 RepID=A0A9P8AMP5_9AGAR|nr:conserved oligomeric Golgi complex component [Guyanagaster necrorhizus MCA 3950]KAG7440047.1 COG complex component [Guyanagaster necrorhizus MCA 3950]
MSGGEVVSLRDPFQLDRLAEELVTRELLHPRDIDDDDESNHDLPVFEPLSHSNPYLTANAFDIEQFLLSRSHTSLQDLRSELRDYLATLKEELVKLINDDYEAFISLSTDLRGEGVRLNKLKAPLGGLRIQIQHSKAQLQVIQEAIKQKLEKRAILREEKALLHLLLKISESVTRLEGLLLISSPSNDVSEPANDSAISLHSEDLNDDKTRGNQAKHLHRIAAEYTQLLYHASKARADKCIFIDEVQWQIDRIQSTLSSDLDHHFSATLIALTDGTKLSEADKAKLLADLTECLRTYDMLGLWGDAEDVIRRDVVRRFVRKTVYVGALAAPHSPIIPHTPINSTAVAFLSSVPSLPRTPYTPFTAFPLKNSSPHSYILDKSMSPFYYLLEQSDEPLAKLYCQILRFVERDLCRIMDIADKVAVKSFSAARAGTPQLPSFNIDGDEKGFKIMSNVVWDEFGRAIMDELGGVIFSAGKPGVFRKNYEITQAFIRTLEFLSPSVHSVESMRAHTVYIAFERRWQLPVYFQMRWKEIVTKLEDALSNTRVEPTSEKDTAPFVTAQAAAVWMAVASCWSAEIYIPDLSYRFWRLTLQLLSRYKTWLEQSLAGMERAPSAIASSVNPPPSPTSDLPPRSSTPVSNEGSSTDGATFDDASLRQYAATISDIKTMRSCILTLWREQISMMLPEPSNSAEDDLIESEEVLQRSLSSLMAMTPSMSSHIISILTKRCCDALLPVRSIPSQFRAMSNKRMPTEPSHFVSSILRPVKVFFGIDTGAGAGTSLKVDFLPSASGEVFENVCQRYIHYVTAMKKTEESLRRLKRGRKPTFSLFGSSTAGADDEAKDEERIRTQMSLDVEAFGKDAESIGVKWDLSESYRALSTLVEAVDGKPCSLVLLSTVLN